MEENKIISAAVDALTGKMLFSFEVVNRTPIVKKRTLWQWLMRRPITEPVLSRSFDIWPCVVKNQYRIAGAAKSLPADLYEDPAIMMQYVPEHLPTIVYIIAAAVQNNKFEPEPELISYLEENLDNLMISNVLAASLQQANMEAFTTSIVLMNGLAKIVTPKTSPLDGRELIASHTQQ